MPINAHFLLAVRHAGFLLLCCWIASDLKPSQAEVLDPSLVLNPPAQIDGCPSILQASVYHSGFYSKSLPVSAYYAFQYALCDGLQTDSSYNLVLPLDNNRMGSFVNSARVLVSKWNPRLEAQVQADPSFMSASTSVSDVRL